MVVAEVLVLEISKVRLYDLGWKLEEKSLKRQDSTRYSREMDHSYSDSSKTAESLKSNTQGVKNSFKEPKIIKYTGGVTMASGERGGLVFKRLNNVRAFQKIFQAQNALPVHLKKGKNDELIYKGLMTASVVALVVASCSLYKLAMPSKPN